VEAEGHTGPSLRRIFAFEEVGVRIVSAGAVVIFLAGVSLHARSQAATPTGFQLGPPTGSPKLTVQAAVRAAERAGFPISRPYAAIFGSWGGPGIPFAVYPKRRINVWEIHTSTVRIQPSCGPPELPPYPRRSCPPIERKAVILIDDQTGHFIVASAY
jgi:hypothetical protein